MKFLHFWYQITPLAPYLEAASVSSIALKLSLLTVIYKNQCIGILALSV